ncbi:succinate--CoA ligase subunit alpha [Puniceicoccales bacterium CK1056]|uniref:Succinate--CoA ligase [ADP-forming] subunit alpha n=1 Tax=Oceanipulchritudo coccoides TaxID=2706888 RepID=A0A6B2M1Z3_9BACT|nr:succinate--CoA ligase subunit alpha [Oceanipulchritudo coccoides]NDV61750.1 succinate--CoA ligase subunit alpha [Oceanipulchritudo coccoides]
MSVLVGKETRVVGQGITGTFGKLHALKNIEYGTQYVAAVTPGKGGQTFEGKLPIFNTVKEAVEKEGANTSVIFVPPPFAADGILEAIDAGIELVICITEGIPVKDMAVVKDALKKSSTRLIGPNCPGIITPGVCNIGIMPGYIAQPGKVGVVSRSGTLTYEAMYQVTQRGHGQSTCIGIGGDPINGTNHTDAIKLFNEDPETEAIVMIGEIGGSAEEEAAAYIKEHVKKPVAAFIAGMTAPPGRRMGHAGAIVSGGSGTAEAKVAALKDAGIAVAPTPSDIAEALFSVYKV